MGKTTRNNANAKAAQTYANAMRKDKDLDVQTRNEWFWEYIVAHSTDPKLCPNNLHQTLMGSFDRVGQGRGATKVAHLYHPDGWEFHHIVIKRIRRGADHHGLGNQGKTECQTWEHFATKPESDMLCPVYRWFMSKSDKVADNSDTDRRNLVMICQKAVAVGDADSMCRKAERMNHEHGLHGESAERRYKKLKALASECGWWDAMHNSGNSGVIFDYAKGCYKAVFIDYAL